MNLLLKSLLIFALVGVVSCSKEQPPENPPLPAPKPAVLQPEIQTLHKAEALNQQAEDAAAEQHKKIDAATQ